MDTVSIPEVSMRRPAVSEARLGRPARGLSGVRTCAWHAQKDKVTKANGECEELSSAGECDVRICRLPRLRCPDCGAQVAVTPAPSATHNHIDEQGRPIPW